MIRKRIITSKIEPVGGLKTLSHYLAGRFTYFTADQWHKEIADGKLSLDGVVVTDPSTMLKGSESLAYDGSAIVEPEVDDRIGILYEDENFIAVNKTGYLPVHPAGRYFNHTLTAILEDRFGRRVFPAHRMDRETSGVMLLAYDGRTAGLLSASLARGTKAYLALVHGIFPDGETVVDLPLGPDETSAIRKKRRAWQGGMEAAVTRFLRVLAAGDVSLVRCFPETGRLHQIRAHLSAIGFPVVGDKLYGRDETAFLAFAQQGLTPDLERRLLLPRQALHAAKLIFLHPETHREVIVRAPLPRMFSEFIRKNRRLAEGDGLLFPHLSE